MRSACLPYRSAEPHRPAVQAPDFGRAPPRDQPSVTAFDAPERTGRRLRDSSSRRPTPGGPNRKEPREPRRRPATTTRPAGERSAEHRAACSTRNRSAAATPGRARRRRRPGRARRARLDSATLAMFVKLDSNSTRCHLVVGLGSSSVESSWLSSAGVRHGRASRSPSNARYAECRRRADGFRSAAARSSALGRRRCSMPSTGSRWPAPCECR